MKSFLKTKIKKIRRAKPLLGTLVEITAHGFCKNKLHQAISRAFEMIQLIHEKMNVHDEKSDLSQVNKFAWRTPIRVHPLTLWVLREAQTLSCISQGAFDVSVGSTLEQWGYYASSHSNKKFRDCTLFRPSFRHLHFVSDHEVRLSHPTMRLDLSGIAKGFAVDCAVQVLENAGVPSGLVNAGGDLRAFGPDSFAVQIRDPKDPNQSMMELLLKEEALCNSGTYFNRIEHCGKVLHHLIDPFRETSCKSFSAAGVLAPSCLLADALSKILMVKGEGARGLLKVLNSHGYVVGSKDNEISWFGVPRKERQS